MAGGARVEKISDRGAVAEVIVHHLLGVERTHEDIAASHVDEFARIIPRSVDVSRDDVPARHVGAVACPSLYDLVCEFLLELAVVLAAEVRVERHDVPRIGRVLARWRLRRVEQAQRPGPELHELRDAASLHVAVRREEVLHRLGADAPFECAVDVRVEACRGKAWAFMQSEVEPVERPRGILKAVELAAERLRQLPAANKLLERLMHIERAGDELGPHRAAVRERDSGRLPAFDNNAIDRDLRLVMPTRSNERLHQAARQIERAALAELVAGFEIEGANHRAHGARRQRVDEPSAEQRDLEQEEKPHVLVLEQLLYDIEWLAFGDRQELAAEHGA